MFEKKNFKQDLICSATWLHALDDENVCTNVQSLKLGGLQVTGLPIFESACVFPAVRGVISPNSFPSHCSSQG